MIAFSAMDRALFLTLTALTGGGLYLLLRKPAMNDETIPAPASVLPALPSEPDAIVTKEGFAGNPVYYDKRPPYGIVLYTTRWAKDAGVWGGWDGPTWHRGEHKVSGAGVVWTSSEDETNAYLDALSLTNQTAGFWAAYRLDVTDETQDGTPTAYGAAGPWTAGRFGDVPVAMYGPFGLSAGGLGTHWWG